MDKFQKETEKILLEHEKEVFNELKNTYANALKDIKLKVKQLQNDVNVLESANLENKSILQSKIYQLNYQKALEEELNAVLEVVRSKNVNNVQSFLTKMYEDSYLSINYDLQKKGIPVITPINHSLIVKTINEPTEKLKFSDRLYKHNKEFKKNVKQEISRGIATGKSYKDIAQQISLVAKVDLNKAYRIARTEGGRVSSEAKMTSIRASKEKGADIVKEWSSALDMRTRTLHARLDGQIAEVDKPFKVGGYEVMHPHGFGIASEDVNCRCSLLSVPRWDIEDNAIKYDEANKGLIKSKNYTEWKQGYYEKIQEIEVVKRTIEKAESNIKSYNLTKDEKAAITSYVSSEAYILNDTLRRDMKLTGLLETLSADLSKALKKMPSYEKTVYRSLFFDDKEIKDEFIESLSGKEVTFKSFISTSKGIYDESDDIRLIIKSKNGKDISSFNEEGDGEVLFDKNTKFKIIKSYEEEGKLFFELEEK